MHSVLNRHFFFIKEHVGMFKAANNFDIYDPESNQMQMICREEKLGFFTKMLRFTDYKRMTPFHIEVRSTEGEKILTIKRGVSIFLSTVQVLDENDELVGEFKQKLFSIGGKFDVLSPSGQTLCKLVGKWTSWDFKFEKDGVELGHVSKKWSGIGKELFTTADNYILEVNDSVPQGNSVRYLILAAVLCIDMVLKE